MPKLKNEIQRPTTNDTKEDPHVSPTPLLSSLTAKHVMEMHIMGIQKEMEENTLIYTIQ